MSINLVEMITKGLSGPLLSQLGSAIGGNADSTSRGLAGAVPAILGGLLNSSSTPSGASTLINLMSSGNHDGLLGNLGSLLGGGNATQDLLKTGTGLLPSILGDRGNAVTDMIGSLSGLNRASSSSLLGMLAPLALGFITKHLRGSGGLNTSALTNLMSSQRSVIAAAAPAGLASALGMASLDGGSSAAATVADSSSGGVMKWIIGLAVLAAAFFALRNCQHSNVEAPPAPPAVETPAPAPAPVVEPAPAAPSDGLTAYTLPDGSSIRASAAGLESQLLAFIADGTKPVDKTTWFTMDGLEFVTGSATLSDKSNAQLDAIAAILKGYPAVKLKVGGYTDNVGNAAANVKLSGERAASTVAALVARGIDASRLAGEGYGAEHPVADNATEQGRQHNRRIDVRVTAK
jgi:OmpA-OmpF porin, OOP family